MSKKNAKSQEELLKEALVPLEEQPYEVPGNWVWVKLGSIIELAYGKSLPNSQRSNNGYPVFGSNGIVGYHDEFLIEGPVIVVGRKGSHGEVNWFGESGWAIDTTYYVKTKIKSDFRFIYYLLRTLNLKKLNRSTAIPGLNREDAYNEHVALPPLNEQKRIADKVERLLGKINQAKQLIEEAKATFELRRAAILDKAFRGELTKKWREEHNMVSWQKEKLENLLRPDKGIFDGPFGSNLKSDDYTDYGVRVIRLENIGVLEFIDSKYTFISEEKYRNLEKHTLKEGDIIFSSFISENIRVCILPKLASKAINKADCFCIRPSSDKVNKEFLYYYLSSVQCYNALKNLVHGATRPRVNLTQLKAIEIPLPTIEEQERIVNILKNLLNNLIETNNTIDVDQTIERLKMNVLTKAFRGQLGTNDSFEASLI